MTDLCRRSELLSREGYRALVDDFPNGVLVLFDAELRYRIVGPERLLFSGRASSDMVDNPVDELFPPEAVETLEQKNERLDRRRL